MNTSVTLIIRQKKILPLNQAGWKRTGDSLGLDDPRKHYWGRKEKLGGMRKRGGTRKLKASLETIATIAKWKRAMLQDWKDNALGDTHSLNNYTQYHKWKWFLESLRTWSWIWWLLRLRQEDHEFKANLYYIVSFRLTRVHRETLSQKSKLNNKYKKV
jgi:hypothetical protein